MSLKRSLQRKLEQKAKKKDIQHLFAHAEAIQNRMDVRYAQKEEERTLFSFSCILAMCCRVLVREFGWGKLPKDSAPDDYFRIVRFAKAVEEEVNGFKGFEKREIQRYLDKVYDEIGVRFEYR